jgi:hypothetical protein
MTQNYEVKEIKVWNHLHIDTIHKCLAPFVLGFNIKDPCDWTHCHVSSSMWTWLM